VISCRVDDFSFRAGVIRVRLRTNGGHVRVVFSRCDAITGRIDVVPA